MLHISRYFPSTLAITFASLPAWPDYFIGTNAFDNAASIFGRHFAVYPASCVGRMDCFGSYNSHPGKWYRHLRNAENLGEQESSEEKNS